MSRYQKRIAGTRCIDRPEYYNQRHSIFRMVSRAIPEVKKEAQIVNELDVERSYHPTFSSFGGYLLCSYSVEEIEPRKRGKWMAELLQNHHTAIFLRKSGDGIAFNLK